MRGNSHVRFLGEKGAAMPLTYPILTSNSKWYNYHSNCDASAKVDPYVLTPHATAPLTITDVENGIFVLATDMDGYGANIE